MTAEGAFARLTLGFFVAMTDLDGFSQYLTNERQLAPSSFKRYTQMYTQVVKEMKIFDYEHLTKYILKLKLDGKTNEYLNKFVILGKVYGHFLKDEKLEGLKKYKVDRNRISKGTLSEKDIKMLLKVQRFNEKHNYRKILKNYKTLDLVLEILAYTGMRPTEAIHLSIDDVSLSEGLFILRNTKTHEDRYVPIPPKLIDPIKEQLRCVTGKILLPNLSNNYFTTNDVNDHFTAKANMLGLKKKNISVYSLRHSFITRMLSNDTSVFKIQKIVGHHDLETTQRYTHLTVNDTKDAIAKDTLNRDSNPQEVFQLLLDTIHNLGIPQHPWFIYSYKQSSNRLRIDIEVVSKGGGDI